MPCGYCDIPGHSIDVCPERLKDLYGTASDPSGYGEQLVDADGDDETNDKEIRTDGGQPSAHSSDGTVRSFWNYSSASPKISSLSNIRGDSSSHEQELCGLIGWTVPSWVIHTKMRSPQLSHTATSFSMCSFDPVTKLTPYEASYQDDPNGKPLGSRRAHCSLRTGGERDE